MSMSVSELVREFHVAAGAPIADTPTVPPGKVEEARLDMAWEEYDEHEAAVAEYDGRKRTHTPLEQIEHITHIARELADAVYVAYGTALVYGIDLDAVIAEVHRANMRKVEGRPKKRKDGKVLKPAGWEPPDVGAVIFGNS